MGCGYWWVWSHYLSHPHTSRVQDEVYEVTEGYQLSGHEVDTTPIVATHSQVTHPLFL